MRIKLLVLIFAAVQCIATTLICRPVSAWDSGGLTNLEKISIILKENREIQRNDIETRKKNLALARENLNNCNRFSEASGRAECEKKYKAMVKSSIRACGADCR